MDTIDTPYGTFPAYYQIKKLEDLCIREIGIQTGPFGSQLHNSDYVSIGTPILTVEHLGENRISHKDIPKVSEDDRKRLERYSLKKGDIVFSRVGSVDRRSLVREEEVGWLFSGRCLRVRPDPDVLDSVFLSYLMGLPSFKEYIRKIAVGATMPSINTEILSNIPICYPPLTIQHNIAQILGSLDNKIELNRKMNETLEAMARAIFKSWFVNFDPVRAKMEDRPSTEMDVETAALYSGEFEVVDGREVPKGWSIKSLGNVIDLRYGKALKEEDRIFGNIPVFGSNGQIGWHNEKLADGPGIIVGRKGNPGTVTWSTTDFFAIDTTFYVIPKKDHISLFYLYYELQRQNLQSLGADSAVPGLNRNFVYMNKILIPPNGILDRFDSIVMKLNKQIQINNDQSITLTKIRDLLLPKLVFGLIRIPIFNEVP
jgi:type I restriction enzyme S subunit